MIDVTTNLLEMECAGTHTGWRGMGSCGEENRGDDIIPSDNKEAGKKIVVNNWPEMRGRRLGKRDRKL